VTTWLSVRKRLADEVGQDGFEAWFSKISLASVKDGVVTLRPPSKFQADHLANNYDARVLRAWRAHDPSIVEVRFDHLATWSGGSPDERLQSAGQQ
jgi:chromosomal replication initiation ATPase DnaA